MTITVSNHGAICCADMRLSSGVLVHAVTAVVTTLTS